MATLLPRWEMDYFGVLSLDGFLKAENSLLLLRYVSVGEVLLLNVLISNGTMLVGSYNLYSIMLLSCVLFFH